MVLDGESSLMGKPIMGLCWNFSSEEWGIQQMGNSKIKKINNFPKHGKG